MMQYDITTFGELLIDFTELTQKETGQTIFVRNAGGAPANVAVAARKFGANTAFLGKVGDDMHGIYLKKVLEQAQVNTQGLILDANYFTTLAFVALSDTGERSFSFARKPGADTQIHREEVNTELLEHTHVFHVGSLSLTDNPSRDTTLWAIHYAKKQGCVITYDPNYRAALWQSEEFAKEQMKRVIPYVDVIKISEEETALLTDAAEPEEAAKILFQKGIPIIIVTLGKRGAYVYCKEGGKRISGFTSNVVDTTGAGDAFFAGFLYQFCQSRKYPQDLTLENIAYFAIFGNAAASLCVEKKGAIPAMPTLQEVVKRLSQKDTR